MYFYRYSLLHFLVNSLSRWKIYFYEFFNLLKIHQAGLTEKNHLRNSVWKPIVNEQKNFVPGQ